MRDLKHLQTYKYRLGVLLIKYNTNPTLTTELTMNWLAKVSAIGECLNITYKPMHKSPNKDTKIPIQVALLRVAFSSCSSSGNLGIFIFKTMNQRKRMISMMQIPGPGPNLD